MSAPVCLPLEDMGHLLAVSRQSGVLEATGPLPVTMSVEGGRLVRIACGGQRCPPTSGHDLQAVILVAFLSPTFTFTPSDLRPHRARWSISMEDLSRLVAAMQGRPYFVAADVLLGEGVAVSAMPFVVGAGPAPGTVVSLDGERWRVLRAAMSGDLPRVMGAMPWATLSRLVHEGVVAVDGAEFCPLIRWGIEATATDAIVAGTAAATMTPAGTSVVRTAAARPPAVIPTAVSALADALDPPLVAARNRSPVGGERAAGDVWTRRASDSEALRGLIEPLSFDLGAMSSRRELRRRERDTQALTNGEGIAASSQAASSQADPSQAASSQADPWPVHLAATAPAAPATGGPAETGVNYDATGAARQTKATRIGTLRRLMGALRERQ